MTSRYDWSAIRAAYEGGATLDDLFIRFGVDPGHVSRKFRRMGVTVRSRGRPLSTSRAEIAAMISTSATWREIVTACGVSRSTVDRVRASLRRAEASP